MVTAPAPSGVVAKVTLVPSAAVPVSVTTQVPTMAAGSSWGPWLALGAELFVADSLPVVWLLQPARVSATTTIAVTRGMARMSVFARLG